MKTETRKGLLWLIILFLATGSAGAAEVKQNEKPKPHCPLIGANVTLKAESDDATEAASNPVYDGQDFRILSAVRIQRVREYLGGPLIKDPKHTPEREGEFRRDFGYIGILIQAPSGRRFEVISRFTGGTPDFDLYSYTAPRTETNLGRSDFRPAWIPEARGWIVRLGGIVVQSGPLQGYRLAEFTCPARSVRR